MCAGKSPVSEATAGDTAEPSAFARVLIAFTTDAPTDLIAELKALRDLATQVINEHVNDNALCAVCGSAFPCELAVLAEHNLDLL